MVLALLAMAVFADPQDGRAQVVRLTDEGKQIIDELAARRAEWFRSMLTGWTTDEVRDRLAAAGIEVTDTADGPQWQVKE